VQSTRPLDLEMPLAGFSQYITPIDSFFVRSHVYTPRVDATQWKLSIAGDVASPMSLTIDELKRLPGVELVSVLECAGNGRRFYEPAVPGLQWGHGAVGHARWRGVRLADVLKRAGIRSSAVDILFDAADVPIGTMPDFQRSIPVAKALDSATLLAYEMNGDTLPIEHGFPLRVVAPGWAGDSWIKWVTSITVLNKAHDGFWMARAYRHPGRPVAPGTAVPPEKMQPVTSLRVKSVISDPIDGARVLDRKRMVIRGVAWGGDAGPITSVDVSTDGGRSWWPATLRRNQRTAFGWQQWEYEWTPNGTGTFTILSRAKDASGNRQPLEQEWNPSGYLWNVVPRVAVNVATTLTSPPTVEPASSSAIEPPAAFKTTCTACHQDDVVRQQRLTREQWDAEITKMTGWGAKVADPDRRVLLDYLAGAFGPRTP
jgi:DMSO/TMAO reductase YedYZ molybdopterin-dependent catalytic subunit